MQWAEFFNCDDPETSSSQISSVDTKSKAPPWKPVRTNLPDCAPSQELKTFVNGSLACVLGSDLNKVHTNITPGQARARDQLQEWQARHEITIKPSDKTGGISIMNTDDYIMLILRISNYKIHLHFSI